MLVKCLLLLLLSVELMCFKNFQVNLYHLTFENSFDLQVYEYINNDIRG